jgi:hypothetical protein
MGDIDRLALAQECIEEVLGRADQNPDVAVIVDLVRVTLTFQRREIARRLRAEARAFQCGQLETGNGRLTYDGALRRAARIAERGGHGR